MTKEGYEVATAFNGREELFYMRATRYYYPGLNGYLKLMCLEVAKTIRKTSSVPVIMLSAKDTVNLIRLSV